MLFWWRWIIKLERAVALEHGYILSSKQGEAILAFLQNQDVFISLPAGYGKSLCYSLLPPMYDKLRNVDYKSIVTDFPQQKQYLKAILKPRNPCNTTFTRV